MSTLFIQHQILAVRPIGSQDNFRHLLARLPRNRVEHILLGVVPDLPDGHTQVQFVPFTGANHNPIQQNAAVMYSL